MSETRDQLRAAASAIMAQRVAQRKVLMLTCRHCAEYFECVRFEPYCNECRGAGRAT